MTEQQSTSTVAVVYCGDRPSPSSPALRAEVSYKAHTLYIICTYYTHNMHHASPRRDGTFTIRDRVVGTYSLTITTPVMASCQISSASADGNFPH